MNIKLLHNSPLWLASHAIRMSHDNHDKSDSSVEIRTYDLEEGLTTYEDTVVVIGEKDKELIERVGNKFKHKSVLEQLVYWFEIDGISRACLQELARHRTARLTVKSTRYTLHKIKDTDNLMDYLVPVTEEIDLCNIVSLKALLESSSSNDKAKYMLPEAFKTKLQWQIDGRNLQCFLELRTSKDALWEIRELAKNIFNSLPEDHKYLYKEYVKEL